ncbi:hypothetical protein NUU61_000457 [Penicillium alfredii]|uniref:Uncharacterized protein n=1 Tax=Penicillium alfredii TaxID=1506179 RepID=A0A9W9G9Q8_9EURO|nr:uncharacterized protein NUU61_000457 [Penicillium alfredii]KAJ5114698.1 hypothetical protein NUU61_000457 [Penicillium alfredii]
MCPAFWWSSTCRRETSTNDLFGPEWTLVHFADNQPSKTNTSVASDQFLAVASSLGPSLSRAVIADEPQVHRIWERNLVLVRLDTHAAW